jgi:hypothetical protein
MARVSPTAEGFRILFRRPSIPLAEIAWRWSFAAAAWFLSASLLLEYASTLRVNALDRLLLATQQPVLILQAIHRIFEGSAFRFTRAGLLLSTALAIAWVLLASLGRAITVRSIITEVNAELKPMGGTGSLLALNFFQLAVALAGVIGAIGSALLASSTWASTRVSIGDAMRLWLAALFLTAIAWSMLNWFLSTATLFAVEQGRGAFDALASVVHLCIERPTAITVPGVLFGLIHFGIFLFTCGASFTVLGMAGVIGAGGVLFLECLIALTYSAAAGFLRIGRLAAYVSLGFGPTDAGFVESPIAPAGDSGAAIDASELILSDVPFAAS